MDLESRFVLGTWAQLTLALVNLIHQNRSALKMQKIDIYYTVFTTLLHLIVKF